MKGKIIDFEQNSDFYYEMALACLDREEYLKAIEYANRSLAKEDLPSTRLLLGDIYHEMGVPERAISEYFKSAALGGMDYDHCMALANSYFSMGDSTTAMFYFKYGLQFQPPEDDDEEYAEALFEEISDLLNETETSGNGRDFLQMLELGRSLMRSSSFEDAVQVLKFIPEISKHYTAAQNNISLCKYFLGKYEEAIAIADGILAHDSCNIFALCTKMSALRSKGDLGSYETVKEKLLSIKTDDVSELYKISTAFCEADEHEHVYAYCRKVLEVRPYECQTLLLAAIAAYNCGNPGEALTLTKTLLKVDRQNTVADYYARFFAESDGSGQKLNYAGQVPYSEAFSRVEQLEKYAKRANSMLGKEEIEELSGLIRWAFTLNDAGNITEGINIFARDKQLKHIFYDALSDNRISTFVKKKFLPVLLADKPNTINLVLGDIFIRVKPRYPAKIEQNPVIFQGYVLAVSSLIFLKTDFESKLCSFCGRLIKAMPPAAAAKIKSPEAFGAALLITCGFSGSDLTDEQIAAVFNAKESIIRAYVKLINSFAVSGRKPKAEETNSEGS